MSTLQVDTINSFTTVNPVEINDNFRVTGSSTFTGSIDILDILLDWGVLLLIPGDRVEIIGL